MTSVPRRAAPRFGIPVALVLALLACGPLPAKDDSASAAPPALQTFGKSSAPETPVRAGGPLDLIGTQKTFADEFETFDWDARYYGAGPHAGRWRTSYMNGDDPGYRDNRTLPGNGEMQVYVDASFPKSGRGPFGLNPFKIIDGDVLQITANPADPRVRARSWGRRYTSGVITSWGSFAQRYGVFQIRAKMPSGKGLWPAFWLLNQAGGWPPEIDVFEIIGQTPTSLFNAVHSASSGVHVGDGQTTTVSDTSQKFHVYSVDWGPREIIFYFDDVEVWRHATPPDMHAPMFVIVNLAVGGKWPGAPNRETVFPAHLDVDWVRVWQRPEYSN